MHNHTHTHIRFDCTGLKMPVLLLPQSVLYTIASINHITALASRNDGYQVAEYGYGNQMFAGVSCWPTFSFTTAGQISNSQITNQGPFAYYVSQFFWSVGSFFDFLLR